MTHPRKAFTLMELIMVMLVVTIALGVAAPTLRGFLAGSKTKNCALEMVAMARWARTQAISEGRVYRIAFQGQNVGTMYQDQSQFVATTADLGEVIVVPDGVSMMVQPAPGSTADDHIDFYPDGHCDVAQITLTEAEGNQVRVVCDSPTELYRVAKSGEVLR